jgi:predicted membrane protein
MNVNLGAGEAKLDLGSLSLRKIDVEMGVGEVRLDLRGTPKNDYNVRIRGGVGDATVLLPRDVGVYAEARGGIGDISAPGLRHDGERYYNDAYRKSPVTVRLDVQGGVGSIKLISE